MIARLWFGRTLPEHAEEYVEYVRRTGVAAHRATAGNLGSMILRRDGDGYTEIGVLSFWESIEAVRAFAGDDPDTAVYFPEDERYLLELTPTVEQFAVQVSELAARLPGWAAGS